MTHPVYNQTQPQLHTLRSQAYIHCRKTAVPRTTKGVVVGLDMTLEGLGEMFEGFSAETDTQKNSAHIDGGLSGGSIV